MQKRLLNAEVLCLISSDAQCSSVWRSVTRASAERPDFVEHERTLERLTPERQVIVDIFLNVRNKVKMFFLL